jgi:hypothetical protein
LHGHIRNITNTQSHLARDAWEMRGRVKRVKKVKRVKRAKRVNAAGERDQSEANTQSHLTRDAWEPFPTPWPIVRTPTPTLVIWPEHNPVESRSVDVLLHHSHVELNEVVLALFCACQRTEIATDTKGVGKRSVPGVGGAHDVNSRRPSCRQKILHLRCSFKWAQKRAVLITMSLYTNGVGLRTATECRSTPGWAQ